MNPTADLTERVVSSETVTGDTFIALELHNGAADMSSAETPWTNLPFCDALAVREAQLKVKPMSVLTFIPYYFRANREGRGHMRVGLRQWNR